MTPATADAALTSNDGLPGENVKLEIGGVDCYFTIAFDGGKPVYLAMVISSA